MRDKMTGTPAARARAALTLTAALIALAAVPLVLTRFGGLPTAASVRQAVDLHYLPPRLVLQVAGALGWIVYAYIIGWTATEVGYALARRKAPPHLSLGPLGPLTARLATMALICLGRFPAPASTPTQLAAVPAVVSVAASPATAPSTPAAPAAAPVHHVIVPGDNYWDLAREYYGNAYEWRRIRDANVDVAPDPEHMPIGATLLIPLPPDGAAPRAYTVRPGDSLWAVSASELGSGNDWPELWEANRDRPEPGGQVLDDPSLIRPGWTLAVPTAAEEAASAPPAGPPTSAPPAQPPPSPPGPWAPSAGTAGDLPSRPPTPSTSPPSGPIKDTTARQGEDQLVRAGLLGTAGAVLAIGIAACVRRRNHRRMSQLPAGVAPPPPPPDLDELRADLVLQADEDHANALRQALSEAAAHLARDRSAERPHLVQADGRRIEVLLARPTLPAPPGWHPEASGLAWVKDLREEEIANPEGMRALFPCPALVSVGVEGPGGQVYLDLEAEGLIAIVGDAEQGLDLARSWILELTTSPLAAGTSVLVVGDGLFPESESWERVRHAASWELVSEEISAWAEQSAELLAAHRWANPPVARTLAKTGADLGPLVVVLTERPEDESFDALCRRLADQRHALVLVVIGHPLEGATTIEVESGRLSIPTLGLTCWVQGVPAEVSEQVDELLTDAAREPSQLELVSVSPAPAAQLDGDDTYHDPDYDVLVRCFGDIAVIGGAKPLTPQQTAVFTYVAINTPVSGDKAADALWAGATADRAKRLANTVSECRTALGAIHLPLATDGHYRVGPAVMTDLTLFEQRIAYAACQGDESAIQTLRGALELVEGPPFTYRNADRGHYSWVSLENLHSTWEQKITQAVQELGDRYLQRGDIVGALWTGDRGRKAANVRPEPRAVIMRAHIANSDFAAAVAEFESYREALSARDLDYVDPELAELYELARRGGSAAAS